MLLLARLLHSHHEDWGRSWVQLLLLLGHMKKKKIFLNINFENNNKGDSGIKKQNKGGIKTRHSLSRG